MSKIQNPKAKTVDRLPSGEPLSPENNLSKQPGNAQTSGDLLHLLGYHLLGFSNRLVHGGDDHVLEHVHVFGIHHLPLDLHGEYLLLPIDYHLDHTPANRGFSGLSGHLLLDLAQLGLQLLGLFHDPTQSLHDFPPFS